MACVVLPGLYGLLVQCLLLCTSIGALLLKYALELRQRRREARPFFVFVMDGSKQLVGAGWIHVTNLLFSSLLTSFVGEGDECEWYWINIVIDTTLGCLVEYALLRLINGSIVRLCSLRGKPEAAKDWVESGEYFDADKTFRWMMYAKQLSVWIFLVVTGMKATMICIMLCFRETFVQISSFVLRPFLHDPKLKLLVVMILTPSLMNAVQFWIVDNIIRKRPHHNGTTQPMTETLAEHGS